MDRDAAYFKPYARREFTDRLRSISGEERARIKDQTAQEIERALNEQGLRLFPSLELAEPNDEVRVFRAGTVATRLLDVLLHPSDKTNEELISYITRIKGS